MDYQEWIKSLQLDADNNLSTEEYLKKRDYTGTHKTEQDLQQAIHDIAKSSAINSIMRSIEAVDVMIAIALNELKIKNPTKYAELTAKGSEL